MSKPVMMVEHRLAVAHDAPVLSHVPAIISASAVVNKAYSKSLVRSLQLNGVLSLTALYLFKRQNGANQR